MIPACLTFMAPGIGGFFTVVVIIGLAMVALWVRGQAYFFGKGYFILGNLGMLVWLLAALAELQSETLSCKVVWATLSWPAIALVPTAWALFLWHYAFGIRDGFAIWERVALVAGPVAITLAAVSNPYHGQFYTPETQMMIRDGRPSVLYDHGLLFQLSAVYLYLFLVASTGIVLAGAFRARRAHRAYFLLLSFITVVPMAANLAYVLLDFTVFGFDPTPFAFSVVLFLITWLIFTNRLFDLTTVARDLLFFNVKNPVLVVDHAGIVAGANPEALRLFRGAGARLGGRIADWPHMAAFADLGTADAARALPRMLVIDGRHLEVQITPIARPMGRDSAAMGAVILLNDTTELYRMNAQLRTALSVNEVRLNQIMALRDDLERQLVLDPLTGLNNRRGMEETFEKLCNAAPPDGDRLVMALLDIDHFKSINDRFGHAVGDRVLRDFARVLRARIDPGWPVFRVGGEEFVVLFPGAGLTEIDGLLHKLRQDLSVGQFTRITDPAQVTFSAGLALWPQDGTTFGAVFKRADDRLYAAKVGGRNRTVLRDDTDRIAANDAF
ncbi:diguanylate cyclase [Paracoccaceae bacterium Fryx2]|nr:diguanylate cyclase [Paracoccaceae bacterium Fryx2]